MPSQFSGNVSAPPCSAWTARARSRDLMRNRGASYMRKRSVLQKSCNHRDASSACRHQCSCRDARSSCSHPAAIAFSWSYRHVGRRIRCGRMGMRTTMAALFHRPRPHPPRSLSLPSLRVRPLASGGGAATSAPASGGMETKIRTAATPKSGVSPLPAHAGRCQPPAPSTILVQLPGSLIGFPVPHPLCRPDYWWWPVPGRGVPNTKPVFGGVSGAHSPPPSAALSAAGAHWAIYAPRPRPDCAVVGSAWLPVWFSVGLLHPPPLCPVQSTPPPGSHIPVGPSRTRVAQHDVRWPWRWRCAFAMVERNALSPPGRTGRFILFAPTAPWLTCWISRLVLLFPPAPSRPVHASSPLPHPRGDMLTRPRFDV